MVGTAMQQSYHAQPLHLVCLESFTGVGLLRGQQKARRVLVPEEI